MFNDRDTQLKCLKCGTVMFRASNFEFCPKCLQRKVLAEKAAIAEEKALLNVE